MCPHICTSIRRSRPKMYVDVPPRCKQMWQECRHLMLHEESAYTHMCTCTHTYAYALISRPAGTYTCSHCVQGPWFEDAHCSCMTFGDSGVMIPRTAPDANASHDRPTKTFIERSALGLPRPCEWNSKRTKRRTTSHCQWALSWLLQKTRSPRHNDHLDWNSPPEANQISGVSHDKYQQRSKRNQWRCS